MRKWFKKHFIPHRGNNHRPHFLRRENIKLVILSVLVLGLLVVLAPIAGRLSTDFSSRMAAVLPAVLSDLTNSQRIADNLNILKNNPLLDEAATLKAQDMAKNQYFAHVSPTGKEPWYWFEQVGYEYAYAGENLAIDFSDSKDVTEAWMNSPTHRANLMKSTYTEVGTGIATGTFEGRETVFVAQLYANPKMAVTDKAQVQTEAIITKTDTPKDTPNPVPTELITESRKVLGAEVTTNHQTKPTVVDKAIASPRHTMNIILYILLGIVGIALLLKIFIKIHVQHPDLIINGMVVVALIVGLYLLNGFINTKSVTIASSGEDNRYLSVDFSSISPGVILGPE